MILAEVAGFNNFLNFSKEDSVKKLLLMSILAVFILASTAFAVERAPLGDGNVALKVGYIQFTDSDLKDMDVHKGLYLGLEGYAQIMPNFYLGMEVGYTKPKGTVDLEGEKVDIELTFVPIELNMKYAAKVSPDFVIDIGAGPSYNHIKAEAEAGKMEDKESKWRLGGQIFVDANYVTAGGFFVGINTKYQITEKWEDTAFSNWRVGGQLGWAF